MDLKSCFLALLDSTSKIEMTSPDPTSTESDRAISSASSSESSNSSKYDSNLEAVDLDTEPDFADPSRAPPFSELSHDIVHEFRGTYGQHPREFRMQLIPSDEIWPNEELEDAMTCWYNKYYFLNERPTFKVKRNSYFAAYLPNRDRWVRCWTDNTFADDAYDQTLLDVELIDHGILAKIQKRHLLPLRQKYLDLPIQAFKGRLDIMDPGKRRWTPAVRSRFIKELVGESFYGLVTACCKYWPPSPYLTVHLIMFYDILELNDDGFLEERQVLYEIEGLKCGYKKVDPQASARSQNQIPVITGDEDETQVGMKIGLRLLTMLQNDGYSRVETETEKVLVSYRRHFN